MAIMVGSFTSQLPTSASVATLLALAKPWHYCMVRVDRTEAHGPHNCIIVPRRMHFKKIFHEFALNNGEVDYEPLKHGFYVPPETKQRHKK